MVDVQVAHALHEPALELTDVAQLVEVTDRSGHGLSQQVLGVLTTAAEVQRKTPGLEMDLLIMDSELLVANRHIVLIALQYHR